MASTASAFALIVCPSCGRRRTVSTRHARRHPGTCRFCNKEDTESRSFWLERFSDGEICNMAEAVFGAPMGSVPESLVASARSGTVTTT